MKTKRAEQVTIKPFLKWVGGKRQLLPTLRKFYPPKINRYFEPFIGGGAVFFDLNPNNAVLSDINEDLVNCYTVVRDNVEELIKSLADHVYDKDYFYALRAQDPNDMSPVQQASRMIYLNKCGFNGLYRVNSKGKFNVPFGRYNNPNFCNKNLLRHCSTRLKGVLLETTSFEEVLHHAAKGDFVYFDPPYIPVSETSNFTAYQKSGFGIDNQQQLFNVFEQLSKRKVNAMLSNSDVPWMHDKYSQYNIHVIQASRSINSVVAKRGSIKELLVTNY